MGKEMCATNRFHCVAMSIASLAILACHGVKAAEGAGAAAADEKLAEVVVTGSLISDPNRTSSSPIVITTAQDLQQSGPVSIESALNQLPQFAPAGTSANGRSEERRVGKDCKCRLAQVEHTTK